MESSNAWERAQRAITAASERDADVITPDNAESPFDASSTMVIPYADADPDVTQRLPHRGTAGPAGSAGPETNGRHAVPATSTVNGAHPGTSPLPISVPEDDDEPEPAPSRPWWRRLFRRG